jgi:plastocyanin
MGYQRMSLSHNELCDPLGSSQNAHQPSLSINIETVLYLPNLPIQILMGKRLIRILTLIVSIGSLSATAHAVAVRGVVNASSSERKAPPRYVTRSAEPATGQLATPTVQVAVALESLDNSAAPIPLDTASVMAQENTAFVPDLLIVPTASEVTFPNRDAFFHNVFSYSPPRNFDLGRYPKGETRTVKLTTPGIVRIFCEIHASMYASIVVVNTNRYQIVASGDEFIFADVAPGRYRLTAVDARGRRNISEITVTATDDHVAMLGLE